MGKKGGKQKGQLSKVDGLTLREESSGKKQTKVVSNNAKSMLKLQHLQKLATWASVDASLPSLGAFFGHRFAAYGEAIGVPPDSSLFPCERCESLLQPGFNCTVRIQKNKTMVRHKRSKKSNTPSQNSVVYKCHFCSHWNIKRGTSKRHLKDICPPRAKPSSSTDPKQFIEINVEDKKIVEIVSPDMETGTPPVNIPATPFTLPVDIPATPLLVEVASPEINLVISPVTTHATPLPIEVASPEIKHVIAPVNTQASPLPRTGLTLLEAKKRKRNKSSGKKPQESGQSCVKIDEEKTGVTSSKRRRKTWTSLKEIAENDQQGSRKITNLPIPFFL